MHREAVILREYLLLRPCEVEVVGTAAREYVELLDGERKAGVSNDLEQIELGSAATGMEAGVSLCQQALYDAQPPSAPRIETQCTPFELPQRSVAAPEPVVQHASELKRRKQSRAITKRPFETGTWNAVSRRDVVVRQNRGSTRAAQTRRVIGVDQDVDLVFGTMDVRPQPSRGRMGGERAPAYC